MSGRLLGSHLLGILGGALVALALLMTAATPLVATALGQASPSAGQRQVGPAPGPGAGFPGQRGPGFGRPRALPR